MNEEALDLVSLMGIGGMLFVLLRELRIHFLAMTAWLLC
mgnify:CR=1 FL=1|jgi:hypothetical protein